MSNKTTYKQAIKISFVIKYLFDKKIEYDEAVQTVQLILDCNYQESEKIVYHFISRQNNKYC